MMTKTAESMAAQTKAAPAAGKEREALAAAEAALFRVEPLTAAHLPRACQMFMAAFNAPPWNDAWTEETAGRRLAQLLSLIHI